MQLESKFYKNVIKAKNLSNVHAHEFLKRARLAKNNQNIAKGYYFVIKSSPRKDMLAYSDSLISFSKGGDYGYYPAMAYYIKAKEEHLNRKDDKALKGLLIADSILSNVDTVATKYYIKQAMGILKSKTGDFQGALEVYRVNLTYFKKRKDWNTYASIALGAYDSHLKLEQVDSAQTIVDDAKRRLMGSKNKNGVMLQMATGILNYHQGNYNNSIDTLMIAKPFLDSIGDYSNTAYCYYYIGLSYLKMNQQINAIPYFQQVDSIFQKNNYLKKDLRNSYVELIRYNKSIGETDKELKYLNTLIRFDSIINNNKILLKDNLLTNYEIPRLLERKEELILVYKKKSFVWIGILVFLFITAILLYYLSRKKTRKKQLQFEKIIAELNQDEKRGNIKVSRSTIPKKDIEILSIAFENYDKKKEYANSSFNKEFIRKDTGVNDHYITDYLRDFIGSSLTVFINTKRIDLSIDKMLNESIYRKYTMRAMAEAVGYTNAATFKRAFKKRTGISPLDFIKQRESRGYNS